ncbi:hypothetical protein HOLleu_38171 [Holothuria leucospilota]|uniref:Uncharacterized protein n=1 Tax=Holothuria leucospilota TaxID=206669 RepID=A0A9Q1BDY0_HOLLE|nr:hypothetical protein HOLleu_38171 [Holothuria leucospilota]
MMEIARSKDIYRNIWNANIGFDKIKCIEHGSYDLGVAAACLGRGHIDLTALPTLVRTLKKGKLSSSEHRHLILTDSL